ncbi:unnamed protein product [Schistosoma turkestanicum]|nr:unnamed protein product [Schistosoma turkestanicum]
MGDLMKFVRQQFFDNNWTKSIDPDSLNEEKLYCIDASFSHMDVKSKLCLLLAFSNMKPSKVPQINKHIENIFLQALDEENNLVKAVATILHSKQTLNYLNFDISPTNEAFGKNIDKLLKSANNWNTVDTPLLAEYLGRNVLDKLLGSKGNAKPSVNPSNCGFQRRGKLESEHLKESYLEKLKDECQRRRVHVPIPGRSFARQDETEDSVALGLVNNPGNSVTPSQSDSTSLSRRKSTFPRISGQSSDDQDSKRSLAWTRANLNKTGNNIENRPISTNDRISSRSSVVAGAKKQSGIKLLEFDELPAFGPKAKQLRKEKERETKLKLKQEKEERARENKAAREASKLARQSERQALLEARRQNVSIPPLWQNNPQQFSENKTGIQRMSINSTPEFMEYGSGAFESKPSFTVLSKTFSQDLLHKTELNNRGQFPPHFTNSTSNVQNRLISPQINPDIKPVIHHPLLSASVPVSSNNNAMYVEEEDDDDDDDDMLQNGESGVYSLGFPKTFMQSNSFQSGPMNSFAGIHSLNPQSQSVSNMPISNLGQTHFVQCLPSNYSTVTFSSPVSQTPSTSASHIRLIRPNISQPNSGGVVKVMNTPSDSPVRIICVMDPSKTAPNTAILQSGKPLNIDMSQGKNIQSENTNRDVSNNFSKSSELTSPVSSTAVSQVLSPQQVVSVPSESVPCKIINSTIPILRPKPNPSNPLVCIAPRSNRVIQINSTNNNISENAVTSQSINNSSESNKIYLSSSSYPMQQQTSVNLIRPSNSTVVIDNKPVVFASTPTRLTSPQIQSQRSQPMQRFSVIAPKPTVQPPVSQTYVQILPRPTVTTIQAARPPSLTVIRPLNQNKIHMDASNLTPQNTSNHQVVVSNAYNNINSTGNSNVNISNSCDISPVSITTSLPSYSIHLAPTSNTIVSNEMNIIHSSQPSFTPVTDNMINTSTNLSSVKIQDDLCLTESQLSIVQSLFQDANRVTRPEKAMIISFIAGSRDNPRPETGQITRIRLSEHRERVLNQNTGQLMDLAVDTFLTMDYSTGKYEKVKCYRNDTPENLVNLPLHNSSI